MSIMRILDKKRVDKEDFYLIQWLGDHKCKASWHSKSQIHQKYFSEMPLICKYDQKIALKCSLLKNINSTARVETLSQGSSSHKDQNQPNQYDSKIEQVNRGTRMGRKKTIREKRKSERYMSQVFEQAKKLINEENGSYTIKAEDLVLSISTPYKLQDHWVFGDKPKKILSKTPQQPLYKIIWSDNTTCQVSQDELLQRDPVLICDFFERQLKLIPKRNKSDRF